MGEGGGGGKIIHGSKLFKNGSKNIIEIYRPNDIYQGEKKTVAKVHVCVVWRQSALEIGK